MSYPDEPTFENGVYPPVHGGFTFGSPRSTNSGLRFFEMELGDAWFDRPGDWSLCRRMLVAGVTFTMIDDVVADLYPSASARKEVSGRQ